MPSVVTNDTSSEIIGRSPETTWKAVKVVAKKDEVFLKERQESHSEGKHDFESIQMTGWGRRRGGDGGKEVEEGFRRGFSTCAQLPPSFPLDNPSHIIYLHVSLFCHVS